MTRDGTCIRLLACSALLGCAAPAPTDVVDGDIVLDSKADGFGLTFCMDEPIELAAATSVDAFPQREVGVVGTAFRAELRSVGDAEGTLARIVADDGATKVFGLGASAPVVTVDEGAERRRVALRIENLGHGPLSAKLCLTPIEATERDATEPRLHVRFTQPACAALPDQGVPAGVFCEQYDDRERSRKAAGIIDEINQWLRAARDAAAAGEDVTITMAYLSWRDDRIYDALCEATAAGARFVGFFDRNNQASEPPRFEADASCRAPGQDNVEIHRLGGITDWSNGRWRLMHVKLIMIETAGRPTRLVFGSANVSSSATSVHFENWVFGELPETSHFVESHRCGRQALIAAAAVAYPEDADVFDETLTECRDAIAVDEDPRYRVMWAPDANQEWSPGGRSSRTMRALMAEMAGAERSVDVAVQHFSALALAHQLRSNGNDPDVRARLLLDDDTFYSAGESPADRNTYDDYFVGNDVDTRFLQTNYGRYQYQHNKYVIIDDELVFGGAGNFTESAFIDNYENFYFLRDPALTRAYVEHFERLRALAKAPAELPSSPPVAPN